MSLLPLATEGQDRGQARSMVMSKRGIVATSQTLASQAGAQVLARGGSAVDAAIAANAVLGVVEPMMNGIGGDLFAIYRDGRTGAVTGLNSSGPAPGGLTREALLQQGNKVMPAWGIHTVTVPGCVRGWQALHAKHGKLPWRDLFAAAVHYAEQGFPVTEIIAEDWRGPAQRVAEDEYGRRVFLPSGKPPAAGDVFRNPDLAKALRMVAQEPAQFYRGEIAGAVVARSEQLNGTLNQEDLARFEPEWVAPISTEYRGWRVWELPPNSQGLAALMMLNLMERFDLPSRLPHGVEALHAKIESQKLAYADLGRYVADPRFAKVPVSGLLSKEYAASRFRSIDAGKAQCQPEPGQPPLATSGDTVYLTVVDRDGNMLSLIQSIYQAFGSAIAVPGFGFHLHNRGALFSLEIDHPNVLKPGKRPFHTIIPGLMEREDVAISFGIMGGLNQAQAHAQFVSYVADHGMNIQAALEAPRFTKMNFSGCDVQVESRIAPEVREKLKAMGHDLRVRGEFSSTMGGGQAVQVNRRTGVHFGASDPRKDGAAIPEPEP